MKMQRLADTNVEHRLESYLKKQATMTERLQQELDSLNKKPGATEKGVEVFGGEATGPGRFWVMEDLNSTNEFGKEMSIVWDEQQREMIVDPFTAIYYLQQMQQYPMLMPASGDGVWDALAEAASDTEESLGIEGVPGTGSAISAATLHAEERINLDELMQEGQVNAYGDEPGMGLSASVDILARVSFDGAIPSYFEDVDTEASQDALLKSIQSNILNIYPTAFVDVIAGTSDQSNVRLGGSHKSASIQEKVYDIICETRRDAGSWVISDEKGCSVPC